MNPIFEYDIPNLLIGYCNEGATPLRSEPTDRSEMVSQILFGESVSIIEETAGWLHVCCTWDGYQGWVDAKMITIINHPKHIYLQNLPLVEAEVVDVHLINKNRKKITSSLSAYVKAFRGSRIPHVWDCQSISTDNIYEPTSPILFAPNMPTCGQTSAHYTQYSPKKAFHSPKFTQKLTTIEHGRLAVHLANKYLGTPYLWGGRSPFGIDCSGLTQMVYLLLNYQLPRDAKDQAQFGSLIPFEETQAGDLAFFQKSQNLDNNEGNITHVGIVGLFERSYRRIIHASGSVRNDVLTANGILKETPRKILKSEGRQPDSPPTNEHEIPPSHFLHSIRRYFK